MFTLSICTHTPARASAWFHSTRRFWGRQVWLSTHYCTCGWNRCQEKQFHGGTLDTFYTSQSTYFHNPMFQNQAFRGFWEWEGRKGHFHFLKGSDSYMSSSAYIERGWKKFRNIYCRYFRPLPLIKHKQKVHMNSNKDKIWVTFRFSVKVKNPKDLPHRACMAFSSLSETAIWTNFYRPNIPQISGENGHETNFVRWKVVSSFTCITCITCTTCISCITCITYITCFTCITSFSYITGCSEYLKKKNGKFTFKGE